MYFMKWILYNFLLSCLFIFSHQLEGKNESSSSVNKSVEKNSEILNRSPHYFWNEDKYVFHWGNHGQKNPIISKGGYQSKGSAGIVPYVIYENKVYILLARETWGEDKNTYCDLGGSVEAYGTRNSPVYVDTFLYTLLKEGEEESGGLYKFTECDFLEKAYVISHIYRNSGYYEGFESILAFCEVDKVYYTEQFIAASQESVYELEKLRLCPWGYQEKDDYQWIELHSLLYFLQNSDQNNGCFENIFNDVVELTLRPHFVEILRSADSVQALSIILYRESLTFVDDTSLYFESIGKRNAILSNKIGSSFPLGITAIASYRNLS